jgi:DNA polymerase/3'-5' exonuclease PolX
MDQPLLENNKLNVVISQSNAEIADSLSSLAQMLAVEKANPYKIRAYCRATAVIRRLGQSMDEQVRSNADLRVYAGIGDAISAAMSKPAPEDPREAPLAPALISKRR